MNKRFHVEPEGYTRTGMSDLQGAWENLREHVVESKQFPDFHRLLFHIDEGMSWESVRDLARMRKALLLVRNIATQAKVPAEILEDIEEVAAALDEAEAELRGD